MFALSIFVLLFSVVVNVSAVDEALFAAVVSFL